MARCGYAVVSLNDQTDWSVRRAPDLSLAGCAVFVPLGRQLHTVPASETVALLCALRNADPPLQFGCDCKVVGDTWHGGQWSWHTGKLVIGDRFGLSSISRA